MTNRKFDQIDAAKEEKMFILGTVVSFERGGKIIVAKPSSNDSDMICFEKVWIVDFIKDESDFIELVRFMGWILNVIFERTEVANENPAYKVIKTT